MAAILCAVTLVTPPVDAHTRKGDKLLKDGQKAEAAQDYDRALTLYEQALEEDAREPAYLLATQRVRNKASEQHIAEGRKLLAQQKIDAALVQFQKALMTDPSSPIALQMVLQANEMVKEKTRAPEGTVILTPAERQRHEVEERINSLEGPPVLRPINNQISSLKINNQTSRVIYESICKTAGINVLFDPSGIDTLGSTTRNFNLDLNNATLEEALQYVALLTHTFWKPISRNAIFVTQESEPKRQEYQDEVVKVFYIQNASTANEFTEIFNGVRIGAKLTTGIFQVASQNAIIARGSTDTMALVEKLVHDLDRPKAEVLIDVKVWEVSKSKVTNLGAALSGTNLLSLSPGTTSTSTSGGTSTTTTSGTSISASQLGHLSINQFSVALPGAVAQALLNDSNTRLLQNPQVRVTDGGKGTLKIGSKIPYVSGSLNSAVATPGSIPYATTQFQQIDVGVNIDVQPHVNGPNDISMHIKVEISSVTSTTTIAGVAQPIIGQKVNEADVRMRDGEYSLLGGLSSDSDSSSVSGLPGVSNIPVLGYLFGTRTKDREKDDILIALVPHIIRAPAVDDQLAEGVLAGTERMVRVERRQAPPVLPSVGPVAPTNPGPRTTPQLPPPGGTAGLLLPPTNNPRMPIAGSVSQPNSQGMSIDGKSLSRAVTSPPAASPMQQRPALMQQAATQAPVQVQQPPGTEVTPLEGMQQMGLTPDPAPAATPDTNGSNSNDSASTVPDGLTAGQDTQRLTVAEGPDTSGVAPIVQETPVPAQPETENAPIQVNPLPAGLPEQFRPSTEPVPAPTNTNPDNASYAAIGPDPKPAAKKASVQATAKAPAPTQAVAKVKPATVLKVQLASGTSATTATPGAHVAKPATQPATTPASAAAKTSAPVQLLEGHLTQDPDSSSTPPANPKQK
jgi:general secretion pathway protein D